MTYRSDGLCALQSFTLHRGMFGLQAKELAEAQERMRWHEMMSRRNIDNSEALQACPAPVHLSSAAAYAILSSTEHNCIKQLLPSSDCRIIQCMALRALNLRGGFCLGKWPLKVCLNMQERRVIEYVSLGDFQTAVGFLLASTPEKSIRYYRDALCTLALAVSIECLSLSQESVLAQSHD